MTDPLDAPLPPAPEGRRSKGGRRPWWRRVLRAMLLGAITGTIAIVGLAYLVSGAAGPPPQPAEVCKTLGDVVRAEPRADVTVGDFCYQIDRHLNMVLGGADGFEAVVKKPDPPSEPSTPHPAYLVWETDGCTAPVLGSGPFDFTLACNRHDFGWRNLRTLNRDQIHVWQVQNKDRVDAGFLYDMRLRCVPLSGIFRIGCDTTARVYYTGVRLNPAGVEALPGHQG